MWLFIRISERHNLDGSGRHVLTMLSTVSRTARRWNFLPTLPCTWLSSARMDIFFCDDEPATRNSTHQHGRQESESSCMVRSIRLSQSTHLAHTLLNSPILPKMGSPICSCF